MTKIALLIGVSEYTSGFSPLPSAVNDVRAMRRVLENPDIGSFDQVQSLENPDRQSMEDAIETLFANCRKDDLVLLFFSGHGVRDDDARLYLAACNARKDEKGRLIKSRAVAADLVHQFMENSKSKRQIIILDCCFSGAFADGMKAKDEDSVDVKNQLGGEGRVVLTSSTAIQYSFEQQDSELSIYTHYLVEGLETGDADQDRDGAIGVNELHEYAKRRVKDIKPEMNPEMYLAKEGYKILLAQAPSIHPELRYAQVVRQLAHNWEIRFREPTGLDQLQNWLNLPSRDDVQISSTRRKALDTLSQKLNLSKECSSRIEAEVLQPYREFHRSLATYKQEFFRKVIWGKPLTSSARKELKDLQRALELSNEFVDYIEQQVLQQIKKFPYSGLSSFSHLLILKALVLLFGSLVTVQIGIEIFKVFQANLQTEQILETLPAGRTVPSIPNVLPKAKTFVDAEAKLKENKYQEAINLYKQAIQQDPQNADYYSGIGISYYELAKQSLPSNESSGFILDSEILKLAIQNLEKAVQLTALNSYSNSFLTYPRYKVLIWLGAAYQNLNTKQDALKAYNVYEAAIQEQPPKEWLAIAYERRASARIIVWANDQKGAREDYEEARKLYVETNIGDKNSQAIERVNNRIKEIR